MAYIGVQPTDTYLSIASQQITGTGSATYTLDYSVSNEEDVAVFVNNVRQNVSSYTVSGNQLTLGGTISASDECWVLFLGRTVGTKTPAVGSVTNAMLQNSSITLNGSAVSLGGSASVTNTPAFEAYLSSTSGTVSNNVVTKVQFNTEIYDTDSNYDNSTNYRFTPTVAGKYFVYAQILMNQGGGSLNYSRIFIYKNGSEYSSRRMEQTTNPADRQGLNISTVIDMNGTTDYLEIFGQAQGGNTNYQAEQKNNHFGAYKVIGA